LKHTVEGKIFYTFSPQQIHTRQTLKYSQVIDYCQSIKFN